jgi:hypothetical protein
MNVNEISPKANVRLIRIQKISRALKVVFLLFILCLLYLGHFLPFVNRMPDGNWWIVYGAYATFSDIPLVAKLIVGLGAVLLLAVIVTCFQLLNLYEKGIIFSAKNVQLLGRIGFLTFSYGLLGVSGPVLISAWSDWFGSSGLSLHFVWVSVCLFLSSSWIVGGLFLIMISRIMDEGRKIQEEQELTV